MRAGKSGATVFRDFTLLMVLGFVAMVVWLLPWINPPGEQDEAAKPPGAVMIWVYWDEGNIDLDTWVFAPGEDRPIGYSRKTGKNCNLLRDDLGNPDPERNFETVYCRGIKSGRYWVNLHNYRSPVMPFEARVEISVDDGKSGKKSLRIIAKTTLTFSKMGEERTALSFVLDKAGALEPGSMNSVFRPLRSGSEWR